MELLTMNRPAVGRTSGRVGVPELFENRDCQNG
jgi:hypothetical protein